jgi:polysaccharide biosynthesis transport protein
VNTIENHSIQEPEPEGGGINWADIVRMLFKHKGKLIVFSVLGFCAAAATYFMHTPIYESTSKIFIRYVEEISNVDTTSEGVRRPPPAVESVIGAEVEILQSWDLANEVVDQVTPAAITGNAADTSRADAAKRFIKGLEVSTPKGGRVITVTYRHPDPEVTVRALSTLVKLYQEKHVEIHRATKSRETARSRRTELTAKLNNLTEQIEQIKAENGISSLPDAAKGLNLRADELRAEAERSQSDLKEQIARVAELKRLGLVKENGADEGKATEGSAPGIEANAPVSQTIHLQYQSLIKQLTRLQDEEVKLLASYSRESAIVKASRRQIEELDAKRAALEKGNPSLLSLGPQFGAGAPIPPSIDPMVETVRLVTLTARVELLEKRQESMKSELRQFSGVSRRLHELERERDLQSEGLKQFAGSFQRTEFETPLAADQYDNIVVVQTSSPPAVALGKLMKLVAGLSVGGMGLGLVLIAFFELGINRTIQRPLELETRAGIPLMMQIPHVSNSRRHTLKLNGRKNGANGKEVVVSDIEAWSGGHFIRPYAEALRDRLELYFEQIGLARKPKLVGVASCSNGAGVSTIASGIAAALSEVGDGKVLLVDMNVAHAQVHPFFEGKPAASLADALEAGRKMESAAENLYLATAATSRGGGSMQLFPKRFYDMLPDFQASDFDYIIFDMPPMDESSLTLAMAGFLDKMLLVVEAGKDNRDTLKRAGTELVRARAKLAGVFNKGRSYGPKWLQEA